jgi:hypothetical protein
VVFRAKIFFDSHIVKSGAWLSKSRQINLLEKEPATQIFWQSLLEVAKARLFMQLARAMPRLSPTLFAHCSFCAQMNWVWSAD